MNVHNTWKRDVKSNGKDESPQKHGMSFGAQPQSDNHGGSLYNGEKCILYWADVTSEVAFVVPTERYACEASVWGTTTKYDLRKEPSMDDSTRNRKGQSGKSADAKIFVVWLESFEDSFHFPSGTPNFSCILIFICGIMFKCILWIIICAAELMSYTCTQQQREEGKPLEPSLTIYIHALKNGLFRIHMEGEPLR